MKLGQAYYDGLPKPEGNGAKALEREVARLTQRIKNTRQMMRDSAIDYAEGLAGIRQDEKRVRQIEEELAAAGRVVSMPPLHVAQAAVRKINAGPEPQGYERRRSILEGILDLRMNYLEGNLEITGKVPVPASAASPADGKKNRYSRVGADPQRECGHYHGGEARILAHRAGRVAHVLCQLVAQGPSPHPAGRLFD